MGIIQTFFAQFGKPEGLLDSISGKLMASTGVEKNEWTISLLNIQKGQVELKLADVNRGVPSFDRKFDKAFSVNSIIFWEKPVDTLKEIRQYMKPVAAVCVLGRKSTFAQTKFHLREYTT